MANCVAAGTAADAVVALVIVTQTFDFAFTVGLHVVPIHDNSHWVVGILPVDARLAR